QHERLQALKNTFYEQYASQYGQDRWYNSLLPALLASTRYSALINRFADASLLPEVLQSVQGDLERVDYVSVPCLTVKSTVPECCAKKKEPLPFPAPSKDMNNLTNYYLLDAASILATEALDIEPGHVVLDMCSAPGGKSIALCQRLFTGGTKQTSVLHCNEISPDRRKRLRNVLKDYLPAPLVEISPQGGESIRVTGFDATKAHTFTPEYYDRVMIDAPCSSERHLLHDICKAEESGNFTIIDEFLKWTPGHSKTMAARQVQLVLRGLDALCFGGTLLYATCSLSDQENDGVISQVLKELKKRQKKGKDTFTCEVLKFKKKRFPIGEKTKYGWICLPDVSDGWGPLYFAVLSK
ncbi:S-adenosyl-L-methionine-dependent methyltransferase, partial [Umbelopsis sp. PMI_123]